MLASHNKSLGQLKSPESLTSLRSLLTKSFWWNILPQFGNTKELILSEGNDSYSHIACHAVSSASPQNPLLGFPLMIPILYLCFLKVQCPVSCPITILKSGLLRLKVWVVLSLECLWFIPYFVTDACGTPAVSMLHIQPCFHCRAHEIPSNGSGSGGFVLLSPSSNYWVFYCQITFMSRHPY